MNSYEIYCALHGHFTVGPTTADSMRCLRCGAHLDGMGLDPRLSNDRGESADGH